MTQEAIPTPPELACPALPIFSPERLPDVCTAFQGAPACTLRQSWRETPEPDFLPGIVRLGWRRSHLFVLAELKDADIFTDVTGPNQRNWVLGDTFEMFFRPEGQRFYFEFHVAPNNQRLQLRFTSPEPTSSKPREPFEKALIEGDAFRSRTWVQPEARQWCVLAEISSASVGHLKNDLPGGRWNFSFSRYDYTRGRGQPVISSTSPHPVADFHRQMEWGVLSFQR